MAEEKKPSSLSLLARMKQKVKEQKPYGGEFKPEEAKLKIRVCPNCGAGRSQTDGLTHCTYCGFEFLAVQLNDGIHIKKEDNSKEA